MAPKACRQLVLAGQQNPHSLALPRWGTSAGQMPNPCLTHQSWTHWAAEPHQ